MKRTIVSIILLIAITVTALSFASCSGKSPKLEDVKERFIYLIENSKEINSIFFGSGLPVYERESFLYSHT